MDIVNYLPVRMRHKVLHVDIEPDFDYNKNRSYQHYFITLTNGISFDATSVKELREKAKKYNEI